MSRAESNRRPVKKTNPKSQALNMDTDNTPPPPVEPWHRSRMLLRNPISLAGIALAIVSLANIFLFVIIDAIAVKPSPYVGILAYMVSPAFLILGLLLMLAGELLERRKKVAPTAFYPRIDLNDRAQRSAVFSFATFLVVFVMVSTAGGYKAYEFRSAKKARRLPSIPASTSTTAPNAAPCFPSQRSWWSSSW